MHRCVYYVDSEVTPAGDPRGFSMPNQSVLDELFNKIQQLEDVNKLMSKEDLYLKAISLTTRAHLLKDAFHINAKVFTGECLLVSFVLVCVTHVNVNNTHPSTAQCCSCLLYTSRCV